MVSKYTTIQGDMWDGIAKKIMGSEFYMVKLIEANHAYSETVIFSAGITLTIPDITVKASITNLPPWKRGAAG